ncbi:hypothetical protein BU23DRAFT_470448 [Bimuria novae-zelandiae CBS 107.79]|uniref:Transcription factor domain-containing protein n=1 Tax=Bimuria novae-zelandiae CBS 107.79 TaxID=1447943 RepID=A0A6A5V5L5_9PLEO|nr:hypothetical protein BU23DRAFT_470448 [Bimuria novae-zelandiae CBS 107.79]
MGTVASIADSQVSLVRHTTPPTSPTIYIPNFAPSSATTLSIPPTPTDVRHSLILRSKPRAGPARAVTLILHTLKSYPQMILRDNTLPPYIHPHLVSPDFGNNDMEPLNNCISLMQMISREVQGSKKLFWKNVRLECDRMIAEVSSFNKWELLASMHALSIYTLYRVSEGETEYNNSDALLLATMTAVATQLVIADTSYAPLAHTCWLDWLYTESRRRLSIVFRIINLIVYFDLGATCSLYSTLLLAPLPSKKSLWEAPDELAWKSEYDKQPEQRSSFGLTKDGALVRLDENDLICGYGEFELQPDARTSAQNWAEWCAGMDGFGGLILLAASMVG